MNHQKAQRFQRGGGWAGCDLRLIIFRDFEKVETLRTLGRYTRLKEFSRPVATIYGRDWDSTVSIE